MQISELKKKVEVLKIRNSNFDKVSKALNTAESLIGQMVAIYPMYKDDGAKAATLLNKIWIDLFWQDSVDAEDDLLLAERELEEAEEIERAINNIIAGASVPNGVIVQRVNEVV